MPGWGRLQESPPGLGGVSATGCQARKCADVGTAGMGDNLSRQLGPSRFIKILVILKKNEFSLLIMPFVFYITEAQINSKIYNTVFVYFSTENSLELSAVPINCLLKGF